MGGHMAEDDIVDGPRCRERVGPPARNDMGAAGGDEGLWDLRQELDKT